ncbi:hypothetical protein LCGC14_2868850 [marine sediment metagenome]|uniref:Uncharacterized protein n=1 Tax=marine sediment metagenome TaxID=412755 RepID=A0A0F8Y3T0_9ZZZZ
MITPVQTTKFRPLNVDAKDLLSILAVLRTTDYTEEVTKKVFQVNIDALKSATFDIERIMNTILEVDKAALLLKRCMGCGVLKKATAEEFGAHPKTRDGLKMDCRNCKRLYMIKYRNKKSVEKREATLSIEDREELDRVRREYKIQKLHDDRIAAGMSAGGS